MTQSPIDLATDSIALYWCFTTFLLVVLTVVGCKRLRRLNFSRLRKLAEGQSGAVYSISFMMIFPVYLILILFVGELSLLMIALMHTRQAAFAAARSAVVWASAQPPGQQQDHAQLAAAQALVPIASGMKNHQSFRTQSNPSNLLYVPAVLSAYKKMGGDDTGYRDDYMRHKIAYALSATTCEIAENGDQITATVRYQAPLHFPVVARFLGAPVIGAKYRARVISRSVSLPNERPRTPDGSLGIKYVSE